MPRILPSSIRYVLGNGQLYLITKIVKSDKFTAKYSKNNGVDASVQVPVIQAAVGGSLKIGTSDASSAALTFQGTTAMPFGFQCFQVGVKNGELSLVNTKAGNVFGLDADDDTSAAFIMCGCYGPQSKMATAISAYSPNLPWTLYNNTCAFRWDGQGTSAATPQVAAAAELYIERNYDALNQLP